MPLTRDEIAAAYGRAAAEHTPYGTPQSWESATERQRQITILLADLIDYARNVLGGERPDPARISAAAMDAAVHLGLHPCRWQPASLLEDVDEQLAPVERSWVQVTEALLRAADKLEAGS